MHTICPRCGADVAIDVEWLILRLELELETLRCMRDGETPDASLSIMVHAKFAESVYTEKKNKARRPRMLGNANKF